MPDILIFINLLISSSLAYFQFKEWLETRDTNWAWVRLLSSIVGVLWFAVYSYRLVDFITDLPYGMEVSFYGIRPTITITLTLMLVNIIITRKRGYHARNKSS